MKLGVIEIFSLKWKIELFQKFWNFDRLYLSFYWADFDEIWTGAPSWAKFSSPRIWWRSRDAWGSFGGFSENFAKILSKYSIFGHFFKFLRDDPIPAVFSINFTTSMQNFMICAGKAATFFLMTKLQDKIQLDFKAQRAETWNCVKTRHSSRSSCFPFSHELESEWVIEWENERHRRREEVVQSKCLSYE